MRNLSSTVKHITEQVIMSELAICGVPAVLLQPKDRDPEVESTVGGHLNGFRFFRSSTFWIVRGKVPLNVAKEIKARVDVRKYIREGGSLDLVTTSGYDSYWITPDGKFLMAPSDKKITNQLVGQGIVTKEKIEETFVFANPEEFPKLGEQFVILYHIDTQDALEVFVNTLRKYRLV